MDYPRIVLASGSPYRCELLKRLDLDFTTYSPEIDESPRHGEDPADLVARLALEKARVVAEVFPESLIISADQVAVLEGKTMGKPGNIVNAEAQLLRASGKQVVFLTGLCLLNAKNGRIQSDVCQFRVTFRTLSKAQIKSYVVREHPIDCAGGFKSEGLGISLFEHMDGDDPTALVGLPLIQLVRFLAMEGLDVLATPHRSKRYQA